MKSAAYLWTNLRVWVCFCVWPLIHYSLVCFLHSHLTVCVSVCVCGAHVSLPRSLGLSVLEASQEPQVEDLQLVVQLHADDAVVSIDTQQDARGLAVLSQNHLHLNTRGTGNATVNSLVGGGGGPVDLSSRNVPPVMWFPGESSDASCF